MEKIKLSIIYYSSTGTNYQLAQWAKEEAEVNGAEVRLRKVKELAPAFAIEKNPAWKRHYDATQDVEEASSDDIIWADALLFSSPSRFGTMPSQMKQFLDLQGGLWANGKIVNKVVSAMTSAQNPHGGQEATLLSFYTSMMHWGTIIVTPGYTDPVLYGAGGNPYGTSVSVSQDGKMQEDVEGAVRHQVTRTLDVAARIVNGEN
ncbi:MAG: NAD(P)H:quinone oxidoreductase [Alkalibacterium sp.]|uniref:NAD(P)H:quinone oxidoreductase n=1 Tax=Alkalibacterium sp. TaxID=1872447 RepID=UPI003970A80D